MAQEPLRGSIIPAIVPALAAVRGAVGWMGLHQFPVTLQSWIWTAADGGNRIGTGVPVANPDIPIGHVTPIQPSVVQPPHVDGEPSDVAIALDWITPAFYAPDGITQLGGYTTAQLNPPDQPGFEYLYRVDWRSGPQFYALAARGVTFTKAMHHKLHLISVQRVVPF